MLKDFTKIYSQIYQGPMGEIITSMRLLLVAMLCNHYFSGDSSLRMLKIKCIGVPFTNMV